MNLCGIRIPEAAELPVFCVNRVVIFLLFVRSPPRLGGDPLVPQGGGKIARSGPVLGQGKPGRGNGGLSATAQMCFLHELTLLSPTAVVHTMVAEGEVLNCC